MWYNTQNDEKCSRGVVAEMSRKWLFRGLIVCLVVLVGVFAFFGIRYFLIDSNPGEAIGDGISEVLGDLPGETSGDSNVELFDGFIPMADHLDQNKLTLLRENSLKVIELINAERVKAGLGAYAEAELLYAAASVRAAELEKLFSHNRPDGSLCFTIYKDFNISSKARAENIASGQQSPEKVMEAWMKSDGHRNNILSPDYKNVGVGVYQDASGKLYWVQLFSD